MKCQYNSSHTWTKKRHRSYAKLVQLQERLAEAKKKLDSGDRKEGPEYWSFEIQHLEDRIRVALSHIGPKLITEDGKFV